jgi:integrase/recombinase XerC/integrase/recombinase XerD
VVVWQTGTVRLLSRMLIGRRTGPVFLTDRKAKPSVALVDVDPTTGRARLSYRRDEVVTGQGGVELASP